MDLGSYSLSHIRPTRLFTDNVTEHCDAVNKGNNRKVAAHIFAEGNTDLDVTLLISGLVVLFLIPMVYICYKRNEPTIKSRSPKLIVICLFLLLGDSCLNTIIYSYD
jgi:hypothetical protein